MPFTRTPLPFMPLALVTLLILVSRPALAEPAVIDHELQVSIDPTQGLIEVQDRIRFPETGTQWPLLLHSGLEPKITSGKAELIPSGRWQHLDRYLLRLGAPGPITLTYGGIIRHELEAIDDGMGRARHASPGTIQPNGVFLDGNSAWYPLVPDSLQRFDLEVALPAGWIAVSQGAGPGDPAGGQAHWREQQPQDDIYLVAADFDLYREQKNGVEAQVYLRQADPELAQRYLEATQRYISLYSDLIGPYPYAKFALVENFWESGYGMPSFTLLGPQVLRLPFIIDTSYPHEILHNWWGNSVYVDYASGNWSEGITYYLADYWMKERQGRGAEQRRAMLKDYADYVQTSKDFPLSEFRAKHGSASQSIGYDKGAMFFHMLRRQLGEDNFNAGLRRFYRDNRFRVAGYAEWRRAFESVSGQDLSDVFSAWTQSSGAPRLRLKHVERLQTSEGFEVRGTLSQDQSQAPFPLLVPIRIEQSDGQTINLRVRSNSRKTGFSAKLTSAPRVLAVDPEFDLFRHLLPGESPVTLSNLFGAEVGSIILPHQAPDALLAAYRGLAETWIATRPGWKILSDTDVSKLPPEGPLLLLGWENRWLDTFAKGATAFTLDPTTRDLRIETIQADPSHDSLVLTRADGDRTLAWVACGSADSVAALTRKVPHYGRYSYLLFAGPEASNRLKGQWPSGDSALVHRFEPDAPR